MNNLTLDKAFLSSIDFFDNILLLDSFEKTIQSDSRLF